MEPFHFLILFLILTGGLTMAAVFLQWEWPWRMLHAQPFLTLFGPKRARALTAGIGFLMVVIGIALPFLHDPGEPFDPEFTVALARPGESDLFGADVGERLRGQLESGQLLELEMNGTDWSWFSYRIDPTDPRFEETRRMLDAAFFPHGFNVNAKRFRGHTVKGGEVYLDADYAFCDNALWSDRPLSSAEIILLVLNQQGSWVENPTNGALIVVARKGSEPFAAFAL